MTSLKSFCLATVATLSAIPCSANTFEIPEVDINTGHLSADQIDTAPDPQDQLALHSPALRNITGAMSKSLKTFATCHSGAGANLNGQTRAEVEFNCNAAFLGNGVENFGMLEAEYRALAATVFAIHASFATDLATSGTVIKERESALAQKQAENRAILNELIQKEVPAPDQPLARIALDDEIKSYLHKRNMAVAEQENLAQMRIEAQALNGSLLNLEIAGATYRSQAKRFGEAREFMEAEMTRYADITESTGTFHRISRQLRDMPQVNHVTAVGQKVREAIDTARGKSDRLKRNGTPVALPEGITSGGGDLEKMMQMLREQAGQSAANATPDKKDPS